MRALTVIDGLSTMLGKAASFLVLAGAAVLVFEVLARYLFSAPTIWAHGYTQRIFGAYFILIGALTFIQGGHVRVDLLIGEPGTRRRAVLDLLNCAFLLIWMTALVWQGWLFFEDSLTWGERDDSALGHVMWPIKFCIFAGASLMLLQCLAEAIRVLHQLINPSASSIVQKDAK